MATESKKFVYVKGDEAKAHVDPSTQAKGTELVLVLSSGKEVSFKAGDVKFADKEAAAAYKAANGEAEAAPRERMARAARVMKATSKALAPSDVKALLAAAKAKAEEAAASKGPFKKSV